MFVPDTMARYQPNLRDYTAMERSLSAIAFTICGVTLSLVIGSWWMQHTVFNPDDTTATAEAILSDPNIRGEFNTLVAGWVAPDVNKDAAQLQSFMEESVLQTRPGAAEAAGIVGRVHRLVIGDSDDQVVVPGPELIPIVRDERVAETADLLLPYETIGSLRTIDSVLSWTILIGGAIALISLLGGLALRPEGREIKRGVAEFLASLAAAIALYGYAIPVHVLPAIDNRTWVGIAPRLALANLAITIGVTAVCVVGAIALWIASRSAGGRRQWSTPLAAHRYRGGDEPQWSR